MSFESDGHRMIVICEQDSMSLIGEGGSLRPTARIHGRRRKLSEFVVALLAFASMMGAALLGFLSKPRRPSEQLEDDTSSVVRLVANLFIVMTSLALGLILASAKNTPETNNRNIHAPVTEIILLDRTMRGLGPEAEETRRHLLGYVQTSVKEKSA